MIAIVQTALTTNNCVSTVRDVRVKEREEAECVSCVCVCVTDQYSRYGFNEDGDKERGNDRAYSEITLHALSLRAHTQRERERDKEEEGKREGENEPRADK